MSEDKSTILLELAQKNVRPGHRLPTKGDFKQLKSDLDSIIVTPAVAEELFKEITTGNRLAGEFDDVMVMRNWLGAELIIVRINNEPHVATQISPGGGAFTPRPLSPEVKELINKWGFQRSQYWVKPSAPAEEPLPIKGPAIELDSQLTYQLIAATATVLAGLPLDSSKNSLPAKTARDFIRQLLADE